MAFKFLHVAVVSLVVCAMGDQRMRGHASPPETLATEVAHPRSQDLSPMSKNKKLANFFRRIVYGKQEPAPIEEEIEDAEKMSDFKEFSIMNTGEIFATFLLWLCFYFLAAFYYHRNVLTYEPPSADKATLEARVHWKDFEDFKTGLFDCSSHGDICFWSCCCPQIRWADTMSKLNIHRFWPGFWLLTVLICIAWVPLCTLLCHIAVVVYLTIHRQEFRKKFEFEQQEQWPKDCCIYFWCTCCAIAQDARHAREACIVNHPAIDRTDMTPRHAAAN